MVQREARGELTRRREARPNVRPTAYRLSDERPTLVDRIEHEATVVADTTRSTPRRLGATANLTVVPVGLAFGTIIGFSDGVSAIAATHLPYAAAVAAHLSLAGDAVSAAAVPAIAVGLASQLLPNADMAPAKTAAVVSTLRTVRRVGVVVTGTAAALAATAWGIDATHLANFHTLGVVDGDVATVTAPLTAIAAVLGRQWRRAAPSQQTLAE